MKSYEVRLEDGDVYHCDAKRLVVFRKKAVIEVYSHCEAIIPGDITEGEK